ncbi:MAG TPA: helix-turn-helix domain-containing protein [Thermomicrobiales bacterium]|nr:helix-turn-helix domain-containing protein [Thermomicrobiales bacterium]
MTALNGEITLRDLLAWEPQVGVLRPGQSVTSDDPLDRDLEWVVTIRSSAPMLPALRGGELVLMPHRAVLESGVPLGMLVAELASQPVAGVVIDPPSSPPMMSQLPILSVPAISNDLEGEINRLLTSRRGDLLRTGADIERTIADLSARDARPGEVIESLAQRLGLGITITTGTGAIIFSTRDGAEFRPLPTDDPDRTHAEWITQSLLGQRVLWIGPVAAHQRAIGRSVARRLRDGIQRALDHADATAPHGSARVQALNALLQPMAGKPPEHVAAQALRAGLPIGTQLHVALHVNGEREADARRRLASLGTLHGAGTIDGMSAFIVTDGGPRARTVVVPPASTSMAPFKLAVSEAVPSAHFLPQAVRQARFIAGLQRREFVRAGEVHFDDRVTLGAFRLLYDRWGTSDLQHYVDSLIGHLLREDRRGLLRETLRVYLEHGGAQRPTAERLGIHRNTLTYRLRQIRSVLELDPDDPGSRLGLHLALLASELPPAPPAEA